MTWQWVVSQIFAFVGLVFVTISYQQKESTKLLLFRNVATLFVFIGLCFLGNISAIIFCGAGIFRNLLALYFAYKPDTNKMVKYVVSGLLAVLIIVLNIVFWKNYFNLFSIFLGILAIVTFMQSKASVIRKLSVALEIWSITYYGLLLSPTNVIIEIIGLISAIIGIIRLDIKKKEK